MPEQTVFERYQQHRARRFLVRSEKTEKMLPRWRTRARRRILVVALGVTFVLMLTVGVLCHFFERGPLLWLPACLVFFPIWIALSIVSGQLGDAPSEALDEWEIQQRNAARSVGLSITQWLVMVPVAYLIIGSSLTDGNHTTMAYTGGLLTITTLLIGGCSPTMILAWSRPDPYPDPHPTDEQSHPTTNNDRLEAP